MDIYEVVSTELGYPVRINDAYTCFRNGQRVLWATRSPRYSG